MSSKLRTYDYVKRDWSDLHILYLQLTPRSDPGWQYTNGVRFAFQSKPNGNTAAASQHSPAKHLAADLPEDEDVAPSLPPPMQIVGEKLALDVAGKQVCGWRDSVRFAQFAALLRFSPIAAWRVTRAKQQQLHYQ